MRVDPDHPLAEEIQREMASSYFAACRKMTAAIDELRALDAAADEEPRNRDDARRARLLASASERVYFVIVQREALELSGYEEFLDRYDVPLEVRAKLGLCRKVSGPGRGR